MVEKPYSRSTERRMDPTDDADPIGTPPLNLSHVHPEMSILDPSPLNHIDDVDLFFEELDNMLTTSHEHSVANHVSHVLSTHEISDPLNLNLNDKTERETEDESPTDTTPVTIRMFSQNINKSNTIQHTLPSANQRGPDLTGYSHVRSDIGCLTRRTPPGHIWPDGARPIT